MNSLQRTVRERPLHSPSRSQSHPLPSRRSVEEESSGDENKPAAANKNSLKAAEWRLAVSELAINLRREIADKAGREEMQGTLRAELDLLEGRMLV